MLTLMNGETRSGGSSSILVIVAGEEGKSEFEGKLT